VTGIPLTGIPLTGAPLTGPPACCGGTKYASVVLGFWAADARRNLASCFSRRAIACHSSWALIHPSARRRRSSSSATIVFFARARSAALDADTLAAEARVRNVTAYCFAAVLCRR